MADWELAVTGEEPFRIACPYHIFLYYIYESIVEKFSNDDRIFDPV